jgi:nucleoside-diphosphate-sugar epimerase
LKPGTYMSSTDNLEWLQSSLALTAAFGDAHGARFVGAGSASEYAAGHERCSEDLTPIRPAWLYGKCKAACWAGIEAAAQAYRFSAAWGRIFFVYGPGDPPGRLIPSLISAFRDKRPIETTDGRQLRDFIYTSDAADLLVRLLLAPDEGAFNIGTGHPTAIRQVIERIADHYGARDLLHIGAIEHREGEQPALVADMTKVRARFLWEAPTSLAEGLSRVLSPL